jgi:hypothetical protein
MQMRNMFVIAGMALALPCFAQNAPGGAAAARRATPRH